MDQVLQFLREKGRPVYQHAGISVVNVADEQEGIQLVLPLFQAMLDRQTVLYLSGGRTPKNLYAAMAKEEQLHPGAFAIVDERYGPPMHKNSNEKMLYDSGLIRFATMTNIHVYLALEQGLSREETSEKYDDQVRTLLAQYQRQVAILGVGIDGHTAGIPALNSKLKIKNEKLEVYPEWMRVLQERSKNRMVIDYDDHGGFYKERITMTFQGLSMIDFLLVLVFGKDKKPVLELMSSDGSEDQVPSRFFKRPDIAKKTLLITDQEL